MHKFLMTALFVILAPLSQAIPAMAADGPAYDRHIQMLGRQETLGHRLVRSMCFIHSGIAPAHNRDVLEATRAEIDTALRALRDGNDSLGIAAVTDRNILGQIAMLEDSWKVLDGKIAAFLWTGLSDKDMLQLPQKATALEKLLKNVSQIMELKSTLGRSAAMRTRTQIIARASSQNRLLEQAGQEACFIHLAGGAEHAAKQVAKLDKHVTSFDSNMFDLTFVFPTRSEEEHPDLELANFNSWLDWVEIAPLLSSVKEAQSDEERQRMLFELSLGIDYLDRQLEESMTLFMAL